MGSCRKRSRKATHQRSSTGQPNVQARSQRKTKQAHVQVLVRVYKYARKQSSQLVGEASKQILAHDASQEAAEELWSVPGVG
jgi:hypothetical protein